MTKVVQKYQLGNAIKSLVKIASNPRYVRLLNRVSPQTWDKHYFKLLRLGNKDKAARLSDLHFIAKSGGSKEIGWKHATDARNPNFHQFKPTKGHTGSMIEPFFHFGTDKTVKHLQKAYPNMSIREFNINSKKPLTIPDFTHETITDFGGELHRQGLIPGDAIRKYQGMAYSRVNEDSPNIVAHTMLKDVNHDAIKYINQIEGPGETSIAVANPAQIKLRGVTYNDVGEVIPLSQRHNFTNLDMRYGIIPIAGIGISQLNN